MTISQIQLEFAGQTNVNPRLGRIVCDDTLSTITTAGYLNANAGGYIFYPTDMLSIAYSGGEGWFVLSFGANNVITLASASIVTPVTVPNGGTDRTSLGAYELLAGGTTSTSAVQSLASVGTTGEVLTSNGAGALPTWQNPAVTSPVTVDNGGTGQTSLTAYEIIAGGTTNTGAVQSIGLGTTGQVLTSNGAGALPTMQNASAAGAVLLSPGGNQIITAGRLTLNEGEFYIGTPGASGFNGTLTLYDGTGNVISLNTNGALTHSLGIVNAGAFAQDVQILIQDPGVNTVSLTTLNGITAVSGNLPSFIGTKGIIQDSAIATSALILNNTNGQMSAGHTLLLDKGTGTEAANAVTISNQAGVITTSDLSAVAAGGTYVITLTNTKITTSSVVLVSLMGGSNTTLGVQLSATAASGSSVITIANTNVASNLNGTLLIGFTVL